MARPRGRRERETRAGCGPQDREQEAGGPAGRDTGLDSAAGTDPLASCVVSGRPPSLSGRPLLELYMEEVILCDPFMFKFRRIQEV